jgi:hypothetical protein
LSEGAYFRIKGLARYSRQGRLQPGPESLLQEEYYLTSIVYRLIIPIAVFKLIQRRLTSVDLGAEATIRGQYSLAKALFFSWNDGFRIAAAHPPITYDPYHIEASRLTESDPATYARQHIWIGDLERIAEALTLEDSSGRPDYMSFGQFEESFQDSTSRLHKCIQPTVRLLRDFYPRTRPVPWRILITQAHLHRALLLTFSAELNGVVSPNDSIDTQEKKEFDWRSDQDQVTDQEAVNDPFRAAQKYLNSFWTEALLK